MKKYFPVLTWLPAYKSSFLKHDMSAGFTVAVMLIPQGMAYAMLAGMPAIAGLYGAMMALLAYTIFGTSKHLSIGPVAIDSLLLVSGVGLMAKAGSNDFILLAALTALLVGLVQISFGLFRLGFIVNFLSFPVLNGFISGAALIISFSQIKHILGISVPRSSYFFKTLLALISEAPHFHLSTLILGLAAILFILLFKKIRPNLPVALFAVLIFSLIVWYFRLDRGGMKIVGVIPQGLPGFRPPPITLEKIQNLLPLAATMAMISFMEVVALGKRFAAKYRYRIDPNQELFAIGSANILSGLFHGYPMGGSFSRTAVNAQSGSKTQLAAFFTSFFLALTLLFLTPLFYYLPNAVLAAIIIVAVVKLIDIKEPIRLYRVKRSDFFVLIFSFLSTLSFGVQYGVLLGIAASILMILRRVSRPHIAKLGRVPATGHIRNFSREPEAKSIDGLFMFRMDASLTFTNVGFLRDFIEEQIMQSKQKIKAVIFDAGSVNDIDATAEMEIREMTELFRERGTDLYFTRVKGQVLDILKRSGFVDFIGADHFFRTRSACIDYYLQHQNSEKPLPKENQA